MLADLVTVIGTQDIVFGEIDRYYKNIKKWFIHH